MTHSNWQSSGSRRAAHPTLSLHSFDATHFGHVHCLQPWGRCRHVCVEHHAAPRGKETTPTPTPPTFTHPWDARLWCTAAAASRTAAACSAQHRPSHRAVMPACCRRHSHVLVLLPVVKHGRQQSRRADVYVSTWESLTESISNATGNKMQIPGQSCVCCVLL